MMVNFSGKRQLLCSLAFALSSTGAMATNKHIATSDERHAISYMNEHNIRTFLLLNKSSGQMLTVESGKITKKFPALYGRKKGDDFSAQRDVTPAGIFLYSLTKDQDAHDAAILFAPGGQYGQDYSLVIHRASENRDRLLDSKPRPSARRVSSGCIVLRNTDDEKNPQAYDLVSQFAQSIQPQTLTNGDGTPYSTGKYLVVLPDSTPINQVFPIFAPSK